MRALLWVLLWIVVNWAGLAFGFVSALQQPNLIGTALLHTPGILFWTFVHGLGFIWLSIQTLAVFAALKKKAPIWAMAASGLTSFAVIFAFEALFAKPNKAPEPTPTSVMPAAEQPSRRP